jgi:pilus assembly protein CpaB
MNTARIVVLTIAVGAGGIAAYLASGSDNKAPAEAVVQLQTVDVLVAKSDIGLGHTVTPEDMLWQTWPAATASNTFIRRNQRPDATTQIAGSIARAPFIAGEPIR